MTKVSRPTLDLSVILIAFLAVAALGQVAADTLESRRLGLARGRAAYLSALTATKAQLSGLTKRMMADQAIKQNLAWNLSHSVSAAMSAKLQKGGLDEAWIIDETCAEIGRASVDHGLPFKCPFKPDGDVPAALAAGKGGLYWRMVGEHPALTVVEPFPGAAARFAVGVVVLDDDWLQLYPAYKALAQDYGLTHLPELPAADAPGAAPTYKGTLLAHEGLAAGGQLLAPLTSHGWLDRAVVGRLSAAAPLANPIFWPALLAGLAVGAFTYARDRRRERAAARRELGLVERCRELLTAPAASCLESDDAPPPVGAASSALPAAAEALVLSTFRDKNRQLDLARARVEELSHDVNARDREVERLSQRLAESAELDSLAIQMGRTSEGFLAKADGLAEQAELLTDSLGGPLAEQAKMLFNVLMDWQDGIAERGARKFIRGLAETPGARNPGSTLLEEQLIALAMLAGEVSDLAVNASVKSHRLVEGASGLARVAGLWHGLAAMYGDAANNGADAASLVSPLERALELMRLDKRHAGLSFETRLADAELPAVPPVREGAWVTALYHVLLALADGAPTTDARIGLRARSERGRTLLVAQLSERPAAPGALAVTGQRSARMPHHLEIARAVLAPFGVSVGALPALDGPFPIALSWERPTPQLEASAHEKGAGLHQPTKVLPQTTRAFDP